eukprot:GILI01009404.1.p1 GENE.GILI01009404.1~~GILI01009404.1.p1  ORF type:complete len:251 (-),score=59.62 GILI01009404.1:52-756(-)
MFRVSRTLLGPSDLVLRHAANHHGPHYAWHVIDAADVVLGRLSAHVAKLLQGKHKPTYIANTICSDYVVIVNAEKVKLTGKKMEQKIYYKHSGYVGGLKETVAEKMLEKKPQVLIERAVYGMLPKNKLRKSMLHHMFVYPGPLHPHADKVTQLPIPEQSGIDLTQVTLVHDTHPELGAPAQLKELYDTMVKNAEKKKAAGEIVGPMSEEEHEKFIAPHSDALEKHKRKNRKFSL